MKATGVLMVMMGLTLGLTGYVAVNQPEPTATSSDDRLAAIEERLDDIEGLVREVRETGRSVKRRVDSSPRSPSAVGAGARTVPPESAAESGASGAADFPDDVAARVESAVAERMDRMAARERYRGEDGKWKPPMDEVAREFGLDAAQAETMRVIFDEARDSAFALLHQPRSDGTSLLDDFADDIGDSGDLRGAMGRFFVNLAKEKVPGRDETYLVAFGELESSIRERVEAQFDEEGKRRFRNLNVDVFEVNTGHDPVGTYIQRRIGEQP